MNALALVIGNNNYLLPKNKLDNAMNDAKSISRKLIKLGYHVIEILDCTRSDFASAISEFSTKLEQYNVGLFFFSGHGLQIDGENYLAPIDADFSEEKVAKYTSFPIKYILTDMEKASPKIKIVILDACRNNPYPSTFRGSFTNGLAPIYAPKGTIIAFSTSPGETAMDSGGGKNSIYTKSILKHIEDKNIPIEDFFKRVRTSVHALSGGAQLSWEHTSLIGDYYFNSGQLIHSVNLPYPETVIADAQFVSDGSEAAQIIEQLKIYDYYTQEPAFRRFKRLDSALIDKNLQFLLGRNILQTALGGEFKTRKYIDNLGNELAKWTVDKENHLLNGILFEIYFDSGGRFRQGMKFKSNLINEIFRLEEDIRYETSFNFIYDQLQPFRSYLFYLPSVTPVNLALELQFEKKHYSDPEIDKTVYKLQSILYQGTNILQLDDESTFYTTFTYDQLIEELSLKLCVPKIRLTLSSNYEDDVEIIRKPVYYKLDIN
jgi:hypothetical protein